MGYSLALVPAQYPSRSRCAGIFFILKAGQGIGAIGWGAAIYYYNTTAITAQQANSMGIGAKSPGWIYKYFFIFFGNRNFAEQRTHSGALL